MFSKKIFKYIAPFAGAIVFCFAGKSYSQQFGTGELHGNFQIDAQLYNKDTVIGAPNVPEKMLMNAFSNLIYTNGPITAGIRFESYQNTMLGFDPRYKGNGIPFRFAQFKKDNLDVTAGSFYEQFGSGLIYRTYEERGLGYDNAMDGFRVKYTLAKGIFLKGLVGQQRFFMEKGPGIVRGGDVEFSVNEVFSKLAESKTKWYFGASFVSKYQVDQDPQLVLPENVGAYSFRAKVVTGPLSFYGEYAKKINDPSFINGFIYKEGGGAFVNASYSVKGFSISWSGKVIDNMNFRSDRNAINNNLFINYLPALTRQHTYNLAATIYPYATQPNGEMGMQADMIYTIKKGSKLGGEYGTTIAVNYSSANGLNTTATNDGYGYKPDYTKTGKAYFKDINVEIQRKLNKSLKMTLFYANFVYNKDVIQGVSGFGTIFADMEVVEFTYKINTKHALRMELQGLQTKQDMGDWATVLAEYTVSPHWFFSAINQYNYGNPVEEKRLFYPIGQIGYVLNSTRITVGYGRQRAGIFCIGGVCRVVPASNGLSISISSSF